MPSTTVGSGETIHQRRRARQDTILRILDIFVSAVIIGPAVVTYWRGTWILMDLYLFPGEPEHSAWVSLVVGQSGHFLLTLLQEPMAKKFHPERHRLTYYFVSRLYTSFFAVICVNAWRGAWVALDLYTGKHWSAVVWTTGISIGVLVFLRALRNLSAPPFAIATDDVDGYFDILTMFRTKRSRDPSIYILDILFSVVIIGNLVVFVWRGAWTLVDLFLFPGNEALSAWASLVVGYVDLLVVFLLQQYVKKACEKTKGVLRIAIADLYLLFSFVGTINVWRGIWNLLNVYFLSDYPFLNNWLTHVFSLVILILMNCSNSILVRGVFVDGEEDGGNCVEFPCDYLRLIVEAARETRIAISGPTMKSTGQRNEMEMKNFNIQEQQSNNTTTNHVHMTLLPSSTDDDGDEKAAGEEDTK